MRVIRNSVIALIVLAVVAVGVGFFLPRAVSVERSITINAPQETVFQVVSSLRAFTRWSSWTVKDPEMTFSFEGPESGVGQKMHWVSKRGDLGTGTMEIKDAAQNERVGLLIEFGGTGAAGSTLSLSPSEGGTKVAWAFNFDFGGNPLARYMGLLMPRTIGEEYESGLIRLKDYVEAIPKVDFSNLAVSRVTVAPQTLIAARVFCDNTPAAMAVALAEGFATAHKAIDELGLTEDGAPISIARGFEGRKIAIDAALPVTQAPTNTEDLPDGVSVVAIQEGQALRVVHKGSYESLNTTYLQLLAYALTNGWRLHGASWNQYVNDPALVPQADVETDVYAPIEKRLVRRLAGNVEREP